MSSIEQDVVMMLDRESLLAGVANCFPICQPQELATITPVIECEVTNIFLTCSLMPAVCLHGTLLNNVRCQYVDITLVRCIHVPTAAFAFVYVDYSTASAADGFEYLHDISIGNQLI